MKRKMYRWRGISGFQTQEAKSNLYFHLFSVFTWHFHWPGCKEWILGPGFWGPDFGEDVFTKQKMYLWRGKCIYEDENMYMKGKMYLWRGKCIDMYRWRGISGFQNQEAKSNQSTYLYLSLLIFSISIFCLFLSSLGITFLFRDQVSGSGFWGPDFGARILGKMCLWRGRCMYEEEDVFMHKHIFPKIRAPKTGPQNPLPETWSLKKEGNAKWRQK